jgi:hypothetical protein
MARSLVRFTRLMKACRGRGRSHAEPEDLIRETFIRFHECCRHTEVRNEIALLARAVSNLVINTYHRDGGLVLEQAQDEARRQDANHVRGECLFEQTGKIEDELLRLQKISVISVSDSLTAGRDFLRATCLVPGRVRPQGSLQLIAKHNHVSEQRIAGGLNVCPA